MLNEWLLIKKKKIYAKCLNQQSRVQILVNRAKNRHEARARFDDIGKSTTKLVTIMFQLYDDVYLRREIVIIF